MLKKGVSKSFHEAKQTSKRNTVGPLNMPQRYPHLQGISQAQNNILCLFDGGNVMFIKSKKGSGSLQTTQAFWKVRCFANATISSRM